jgi:hypothetical protein
MLRRRTNHTMLITVNTRLFEIDAMTTASVVPCRQSEKRRHDCALDGRYAR